MAKAESIVANQDSVSNREAWSWWFLHLGLHKCSSSGEFGIYQWKHRLSTIFGCQNIKIMTLPKNSTWGTPSSFNKTMTQNKRLMMWNCDCYTIQNSFILSHSHPIWTPQNICGMKSKEDLKSTTSENSSNWEVLWLKTGTRLIQKQLKS